MKLTKRPLFLTLCAANLGFAFACSSTNDGVGPVGASGSAGAMSSTGAVGSGATAGANAAVSSGGAAGTGSAMSSGGTPSSSGAAGSGGASNAGGASGSGGAVGQGGASGSATTGGGGTSGGSPGAAGSASGGAPGQTGEAIGWASRPDCGPKGTTGGDGGPTVTVTTADALSKAVRSPGAQIIKVSGKIDLGGSALQISSDKTLLGVDGAEIVGTSRVYNAKNVILKNIKFNGGYGADDSGTDAAEVTASTCVWIDHCEFFDGSDGNLDLVRGTDLVTVSWSKFYYVVRMHSHRLSNLLGNNDADTPGKINVTLHHNWWGTAVIERMPRVRNGKVHVFNNYYSASGNNYCIGGGTNSQLVVENNYFDGVNDPIRFQLDNDTAQIVESGNDFSHATGAHDSRGASFKPADYYRYTLESAQSAKSSVMSGAGVK